MTVSILYNCSNVSSSTHYEHDTSSDIPIQFIWTKSEKLLLYTTNNVAHIGSRLQLFEF